MGTIWCWVCAIADLLQGKFIRASAWFSLGLGGLWWWTSTDIDFDTWLRDSAAIVGIGVIASLLVFIKRHSRPAIPAATTPADAMGTPLYSSISNPALVHHGREPPAQDKAVGGYPGRLSAARTYPPPRAYGPTSVAGCLASTNKYLAQTNKSPTWS